MSWQTSLNKIFLVNCILFFDTIFLGVNNYAIKHNLVLNEAYFKNSFVETYLKNSFFKGSGCGSAGRAVTSDSRGPWFESSHRKTLK